MGNDAKLSVASETSLDVRDFSIVASMGDLFTLEVVAVSTNHFIDPDEVIGQSGSFSLGPHLAVKGVAVEFDLLRVDEDGLATYAVVLSPRAHLLTQRKNYRVYQYLSELDIAKQILSEWQVPFRVRANTSAHLPRKFRVQYDETDFDFMKRMLEDASICFYFEFGEETVLVLDDEPTSQELQYPNVRFSDVPGVSDADFVTKVVVRQRTRPGAMAIGDLDYRKGSTQQPRLDTKAGLAQEANLEVFEYSPGAFLYAGASAAGATPTADDRGTARTNEQAGKLKVRKQLEAYRADAKKISFESSLLSLVPGSTLSIANHPSTLVEGRGLLVVRSSLSGQNDGDWRVFAECVETSQAYRPPRTTRKPMIRGLESATVVGPSSEEIHTDEYARVRVQFHWDREGKRDEASSCWVPTNQPWAGAGFGGTVIPRIGQEVLVSFLGGDPDRPVVLGRVYTEHQPPPYPLPQGMTLSGLVGRSTPHFVSGSSGAMHPGQVFGMQYTRNPQYRELGPTFQARPPEPFPRSGTNNAFLLDDTTGGNMVFLQAERDLNILVKNDWKTVVGNYRSTYVHDVDVLEVRNKQFINVMADQLLEIRRNQTIEVGNERREDVLEEQGLIVRGNARVHSEGVIDHRAQTYVVLEAGKTIEFRVGGSRITIDEREITVQSAKVNINDTQVCYDT